MDEKALQNRKSNARVDWIILIATAVGLIVVIAASVQAGEQGLFANLVSRITLNG